MKDEQKSQDNVFIPNCTQVPNVIFDRLIPNLEEAEARCLLYLCRRTYGFHKIRDKISLTQFVSGIKDKNGNIIDEGTKMSKPSVIKALKFLESAGIIKIVRNINDNCYELDLEQDINEIMNRLNSLTTSNRLSRLTISSKADLPEVVKQLNRQNSSRNNREIIVECVEPKDDVNQILEFYDKNIQKLRLKKNSTSFAITGTVQKMLKTRLETYTVQEIKDAILAFSKDEWWKNKRHLGLKWFLNEDTLEKFLNMKQPIVDKIDPTIRKMWKLTGDPRANDLSADLDSPDLQKKEFDKMVSITQRLAEKSAH